MGVLTKLLIRSFGKEFYKINAGFLISSFVLVFGYGIFIKTAGHIYPEQYRTINLSLLLNFIDTPIITLMVCLIWFLYTIKSWKYIRKRSLDEDQLFWRYSLTSAQLSRQFLSWFLFQLFVFLPLILYWLIALAYGVFTHHYTIPLFIGVYLLVLALLSATLYVYHFNYAKFGRSGTYGFRFGIAKWPKPLFSLFLFEILFHNKLAYLLTKCFSFILLLGLFHLFSDVDYPARAGAMIAICISSAHAILAYQDYAFTETYLGFTLHLPHKRLFVYLNVIYSYILLLLPELVWFLFAFSFPLALKLIGLSLSGILFIRVSLCLPSVNMRSFIKLVFGWFFISTMLLLYDYGWYLITINSITSFIVYYLNYYKKETTLIR